nr:MAG TPA: hypothetical protein [Bacteriophage sp.]
MIFFTNISKKKFQFYIVRFQPLGCLSYKFPFYYPSNLLGLYTGYN